MTSTMKQMRPNGRGAWVTKPVSERQTIVSSVAARNDKGGSGDNWKKIAPALVKSSPPAYQHLGFYGPDSLPSIQSTISKKHPNLTSLTPSFKGSDVPTITGLYWHSGAMLARCHSSHHQWHMETSNSWTRVSWAQFCCLNHLPTAAP